MPSPVSVSFGLVLARYLLLLYPQAYAGVPGPNQGGARPIVLSHSQHPGSGALHIPSLYERGSDLSLYHQPQQARISHILAKERKLAN